MSDYQEQALAYLKGELSETDRAQFEELIVRSPEARMELERGRALIDLLNAANEELIVRRVDRQMESALDQRASDIHIIGERGSVGVWVRVNGQLREIERVEKSAQQAVVDRWKLMAGCNVEERTIPQDGRIPINSGGREFDVRVNFLPTVYGERVTACILDRQNILLGLDNLGLSETQSQSIKRLVELPNGFIFTSGKTDSGKTTLLYSMMQHLFSPAVARRNVMTVEDPVEYAFDGMSQVPVNRSEGLGFARALRAMKRADPDVVHISEMRDLETAELGVELALTGHLILSVLHTTSALLIPKRLCDMGIVPFLIPQTMRGMIGQRLVRRNCSDCREVYAPTPDELRKAKLTAGDGPFFRGMGCASCGGTGVLGRLGLYEVVEVGDDLRELIAKQAGFAELWDASFRRTGGSLLHDASDKVRQGLTTVERINRALFDYPETP